MRRAKGDSQHIRLRLGKEVEVYVRVNQVNAYITKIRRVRE
jgi:predicted lysophospholipase L1 biosynthesis ABC-type transport system permease subunit